HPQGPAGAVLHPARPGQGHALLLLRLRHDPQLRALAGLDRRGPGPPARRHGLPPRLPPPTGRRPPPLRRQALGPPARVLRPREGHLLLDQELPHRHRVRRSRRPQPPLRVLRPHPYPAGVGQGVLAQVRGPGHRPGHLGFQPWTWGKGDGRVTLEDLVRLRRARDRMDRDYAGPLDVPALARVALMSPGHFSRSFRAAFGETPDSYLMTRRIERAKALLRRGDLTVTDVCFAVGCTSLGSFSTRFTEL